MDKYKLVLDIIEHPDKYSSEKLQTILSDPKTKALYNLLCKTDSAIEANKEVDIDAEWEVFSHKHNHTPHRRLFAWFGSRAASIAVIVFTSIVAVAAGIAITVSVTERKAEPMANAEAQQNASAVTVSVPADSTAVPTDTVKADLTPMMFEDEALETIMDAVANRYGVDVKFNNKEVASLHLYYKFDPALTLDDVIAQLNTFEQINIKQNNKTLTID